LFIHRVLVTFGHDAAPSPLLCRAWVAACLSGIALWPKLPNANAVWSCSCTV
jgi:hypothetical protein